MANLRCNNVGWFWCSVVRPPVDMVCVIFAFLLFHLDAECYTWFSFYRRAQTAKSNGRRSNASYINNLRDGTHHRTTKQTNADRAKPGKYVYSLVLSAKDHWGIWWEFWILSFYWVIWNLFCFKIVGWVRTGWYHNILCVICLPVYFILVSMREGATLESTAEMGRPVWS